MTDQPSLTAYQRAVIQMEYAVPLLRDLQEVLGEQVVLDALAERLRRKAEAAAANAVPRRPGDTRVLLGMERFAEGGALEYEVLANEPDAVDIDVRGCAYARLMDGMDATDLGDLLLCGEDHVAVAKAGTRLERTTTRMLGGDRCDFRFRSGDS